MEDRQWGSILGALTGGAGGAALGNALGSAAGKDTPKRNIFVVSTDFHFYSQVLLLEVTETSEESEEL